jgi:hypothetical protein
MNAQRASFLLLVALAVSPVAIPVWGPTTTTGSSTGVPITQGSASIPDLSGIWAHLSWPGVERPTSGAGSCDEQVTSGGRERYLPAGRRLHQSDTQAGGSGDREAARRNLKGAAPAWCSKRVISASVKYSRARTSAFARWRGTDCPNKWWVVPVPDADLA